MKENLRKLINLKIFIGIILAVLPSYLLKFTFLGLPFNGLEALISLALLLWIKEKRFKLSEVKELFKSKKKNLFLIALLFLSLFISNFFSENFRLGLGIIKGWFIFPLILGLLSTNIFKGERKTALMFFYWGAWGFSLLALIGFFFGRVTYDGRLQGIFNSPNYLAMYLAPAIMIGIFLWKEGKNKYLFSLPVILGAFYLTYSFAAWGALLGSFFFINLLNWQKKINLKTPLGILIFITFLLILQLKTEKLDNLLNLSERSSLASRAMIWEVAGKIIQNHPIWGIGPGQFQEKYLEYQKYYPPYLEWAVPHPHSLYLNFYLSTGILGLGAFLVLVSTWLKKALRERDNQTSLLLLGIMVYILAHGLVDTTYFKNDLATIFWTVFFLL